jgi:trimethylamine:corrinoid methyltransferase-like protein
MLETVVQQIAEIIAGIVLAQICVPGASVVYAPSATTMDMRSGVFAGGTPEGMLIIDKELDDELDAFVKAELQR